jgi:two-component system response regulator PilR (NtrC family)
LTSYGVPGNVRELENILERAITLRTGGAVRACDIQLRDAPGTVPAAGGAAAAGAVSIPAANGGGLGDQLEEVERDAILKALEQTRYNKTAAAKLLGMTFRALRYRIKKLGIE